jgi:hypothetical protein
MNLRPASRSSCCESGRGWLDSAKRQIGVVLPGPVDVGPMLDSKDGDGGCFVVDVVDDAIRARVSPTTGSGSNSSVSSSAARVVDAHSTAAGRPLRVTVMQPCGCSTRSRASTGQYGRPVLRPRRSRVSDVNQIDVWVRVYAVETNPIRTALNVVAALVLAGCAGASGIVCEQLASLGERQPNGCGRR